MNFNLSISDISPRAMSYDSPSVDDVGLASPTEQILWDEYHGNSFEKPSLQYKDFDREIKTYMEDFLPMVAVDIQYNHDVDWETAVDMAYNKVVKKMGQNRYHRAFIQIA